MPIDAFLNDLPARLELAAETVDDLANSDWVAGDEHRERLFGIEAQIWRISRTTRRALEQSANLLPFLDRSLRALRSNVGLCLRAPVCDENNGVKLLEGLIRDLDTALSDLELVQVIASAEGQPESVEDEEPTFIRRAAGGTP